MALVHTMDSSTEFGIMTAEAALHQELNEIQKRRCSADTHCLDIPNGEDKSPEARAACLKLTALCLSGGGIRSSAFCLGVLQSLAGMRVLNEFDYLSTVSGGGFIGGWLQMLIRSCRDIDSAQEVLTSCRNPPLHRLRAFTNYLTPETGLFSADVWAGVVLYLRNLILNWLIFGPLLLLIALAPIVYRTALASVRYHPMMTLFLLGLSIAALTFATTQACTLLPSHRSTVGYARARDVAVRVVLPLLIWAFLTPAAINSELLRNHTPWWIVPPLYAIALLGGYLIAWMTHRGESGASDALYGRNCVRWIFATMCSTLVLALAIKLSQQHVLLESLFRFALIDQASISHIGDETSLGIIGPLWFAGTHLFHTTFYVGFRKEGVHTDLDREWLARMNGIVLLFSAVWAGFSLSCLLLPIMLGLVGFSKDTGNLHSVQVMVTGAASTVTGSCCAWLGKKLSVGLGVADKVDWRSWLPTILALVFAAGLFTCVSSLLQNHLGTIVFYVWHPADHVYGPHLLVQLLFGAAMLFLMYCFGRVNVNRFSMHAIYRNRLARAFLGSARQSRRPDPFTGFDADDNPGIAEFADVRTGQRLFPVINMTLNVTASTHTARAERKAEAFVATPLSCGSAMLRHPTQAPDKETPDGAFVKTTCYAGMESRGDRQGTHTGPRLGSLLTISGAAISPNWGYHSGRLTAFVMTLFNMRLGAWLPNPAVAKSEELRLAKPRSSSLAIMSELIGRTTDTSQAVYLSDGGHFENLGLYEMLRRRCHRILVIDAGQDSDCAFFDLGNAIRKARIDLGVEVMMPSIRIVSRKAFEADKNGAKTALAIAVGTIKYREGSDGRLIYLKPSYLSELPADVLAYGRSDVSFPHDSTVGQWFTESRFESYRALGRWHLDQLEAESLEALFVKAGAAVKPAC